MSNPTPLTLRQIEDLKPFDSATICNAIELFNVRPFNTGYMDDRVRCVFPKLPPMIGYAVTATFRSHAPGRGGDVYSGLQKLIEALKASPQPTVVVFQDLDNPSAAATFGEVMCTAFRAAGAAGLVTSGMGRDIPQIEPLAFPVFVHGINPSHAYCRVIDVNVSVHVGGLTVYPGDLLHGDANGVTTIPHEIGPKVAEAAKRIVDAEGEFLAYARGKSNIPAAELIAQFDKFRAGMAKVKGLYK